MDILEQTSPESVIFEDSRVLVALARESYTKGHCVVIWKSGGEDLNDMKTEDYEYLMDVVDVVRGSLKMFYQVEKVYLAYLDETKWIHWHLIPRYEEKGFDLLKHKPSVLNNFADAPQIAQVFNNLHKKMMIER